jgi:glycyl-tRNA synthetase beta chain
VSKQGQDQSAKGKQQRPASVAPATLPLLIEIGCEEIPARFLADAQKQLGDLLLQQLSTLNLLPVYNPRVNAYLTPRRLIVHAPAVLELSTEIYEEREGPPVSVAFAPDGRPTRAAEGFAKRLGVSVADIEILQPDGTHIGVCRKLPQQRAAGCLPGVLAGALLDFEFSKSMYWTAKAGPRFVRPIRWILALLGEGNNAKVIPFEIAGVKSGNRTFGHRLHSSKPIEVSGFGDFQRKLAKADVEIDPAKRAEMVRGELKASLEALNLRAVADPWLEDWVVNSTEWPSAVVGTFESKFLDLPREILITVMRDHQKYFAVQDANGNLEPKFVAFLNRKDDPKGLIRAGHERVLRARFTDAQFFWETDLKTPLNERVNLLTGITYHAKLGSYADKINRMEAIAKEVCTTLEQQGRLKSDQTAHALRAVKLCKCDLTTQMVREFPELQGVAGGLYARSQPVPEPREVADAIYDHYLPQSADDKCPRSVIGAVVSLADKLDSVIEGFRTGLEPTGSSDSFGLRRAGNGIVRIAAEALPGLDIQKLLPSPIDDRTCQFLRERVEYFLSAKGGFRYDTVRAVSRHSFRNWNVPSDAIRRAAALEKIRDSEDFLALAVAAKRTRNILEKSAGRDDFAGRADVDASLIGDGPERDLYQAYLRARSRLETFYGNGDYETEFRELAALRPVVDRFFDKVLVMDKEPKIRANRLRLLTELRAWVFTRFADISEIESSVSTVGAPTSEKATTGD